jgi:hypothetical protein
MFKKWRQLPVRGDLGPDRRETTQYPDDPFRRFLRLSAANTRARGW